MYNSSEKIEFDRADLILNPRKKEATTHLDVKNYIKYKTSDDDEFVIVPIETDNMLQKKPVIINNIEKCKDMMKKNL